LFRQGKPAAALPQVEQLRAAEPANPNYRSLEAAILAGIGEYARSIDIYAECCGATQPGEDLAELRACAQDRRPIE